MPVVFTPYLERLRGDDTDDTDEPDGRPATPVETDGATDDGPPDEEGRRWQWVAGFVAAGLLALGIRRVAGRRESE